MEIKHANSNNFDELVSEGYVLVDFFATWCGPCKMLGPVLESIEDTIQIVKVDIDECGDIATKFGVMSVPTLYLFKDGKIVSEKVGYNPAPILIDWINENK